MYRLNLATFPVVYSQVLSVLQVFISRLAKMIAFVFIVVIFQELMQS